ncbi:MAG: hypothetical protein R3266_00460, partial [Gemmatimonadota bacterium]|nr:hypothetical protein [Gemmatimonadota bacterium]
MARLLRARLEADDVDPHRVVTVAELLGRALPYPAVRSALHLAGKAEYDLSILRLLTTRELLQVDPAVLEAADRALEEVEPGLGFAEHLGECLVRLRAAPKEGEGGPAFALVEPVVESLAGEAAEDAGVVTDAAAVTARADSGEGRLEGDAVARGAAP